MSQIAGERAIPLAAADVLVVSPTYSDFTKSQIDRLARRCRSVTVLVRYNRFADVGEYVPISYLRPHRKSAVIDRTDQPANVTVVPLPLWYLPIDYHYRRLGEKHYRKARGVIDDRDVDFDLIHAHFTWTSGYVAARLGEDFDVPSVLTVHGNEDWLREMYESGREDVHETWETVDAIVRVNEQDVPLLEEFNDAVHSIPNGFSRDRFPDIGYRDARAELGVDHEENVLFGLGVLEERKRYHHLVDAVGDLDDRFEPLTCVIAGSGAQLRSLRRRVKSAGLEDQVTLTGHLPQDAVAKWMNAADLFVLPSEAEGNPTVMFEALGCGTPYVGTTAGGVGEIVTSDAYGLTYPTDEPERLPALVERGLERDWDREAIRDYGERFTWDRIVERTVEIYPGVVTESATRPAAAAGEGTGQS